MSAPITETDTFPPAIQTPVLGDRFTYPGTVQQALTDLTNRTHQVGLTLGAVTTSTTWENVSEGAVLSPDITGAAPFLAPTQGRADFLRSGILQIGGKIVGLRSLTAQPYDEQVSIGAGMSAFWAADFGASVPGRSQTDVSFAYPVVFPITAPMPDPTLTFGTTTAPRSIRAVRARVGRLGGSAHAAAPATKRILDLCYADLYAGTPATVVVATVTDSAASGATYDAFHDITLTLGAGAAVIANASRMWFVRLQGESGANSVVGHGLIDLRVCYTLV